MKRVEILFLAGLVVGCGKDSGQVNQSDAVAPLLGVQEEFKDSPGLLKTVIRDGNDKISMTGYYLRGKKESSWVEYHPNGSMIKSLSSYVQDKKEGMSLEFNTSNQLVKRCFYHNDQLHGEYKEYNAALLKEERYYEQGKLEGIVRIYYDDGALLEEGYYKAGVREGISKWYDKAGNVTIQYEYKNGQLVKK